MAEAIIAAFLSAIALLLLSPFLFLAWKAAFSKSRALHQEETPPSDVSFKLSKQCQLIIEYSGGSILGHRRTITLQDIGISDRGAIYLLAHCHTANAPRTFRADRVLSMFDANSGEEMDLRRFLEEQCSIPLWSRRMRAKMSALRT